MMRCLFIFVLLHALALIAHAGESFPLQGYARVGRFMPVRFDAPGELQIAGVTPASVRSTGIVPVLVLREHNPSPLKILRDDQVLVAAAGQVDMNEISALFPDKQIITLTLDKAFVPTGLALAWESIDLLALDRDSPLLKEENKSTRTQLLAAGVKILVHGQGTMGMEIVGVRSSFCEQASEPAESWRPGVDRSRRRSIFLQGVIVLIALMLASLWTTKAAARLVVILSVLATGVLLLASSANHVIHSINGYVLAASRSHAQIDAWNYSLCADDMETTLPLYENIRPIFSDADSALRSSPTVLCDAQGQVSLQLEQKSRRLLVTLCRTIEESPITATATRERSPLLPLVNKRYLSPEVVMVGAIEPVQGHSWPGILLRRVPARP